MSAECCQKERQEVVTNLLNDLTQAGFVVRACMRPYQRGWVLQRTPDGPEDITLTVADGVDPNSTEAFVALANNINSNLPGNNFVTFILDSCLPSERELGNMNPQVAGLTHDTPRYVRGGATFLSISLD